MFVPSTSDLLAILPQLILTASAGLLLLLEAFSGRSRSYACELTLVAVAAAAWARLTLPLPGAVWSGALRIDPVSAFVDLYVLAAVFLTAWMAGPYMRRNDADQGELYVLLLLAAVGATIMASSVDALVLFLGLELLSIPLYVLNASLKRVAISVEAGLKYFVVGAFASAFLVYGIALLYGETATTDLVALGAAVVERGGLTPMLAVGLAMVVGAFGFKLALFPFHAWAPDVYQGSPTPVTAFLSVVPKGAALVALMRIVDGMGLLEVSARWVVVAGIIAVGSQTLGNVVAIVQRDVKRMLAYSGIAHMGYAMVAVVVAGVDGAGAVLVYLAAYTVMNLGAFAAVAVLERRADEPKLISDLAGQGWERPVVALALTVCLFSLAGIPPLVGFTAKFVVFRAAVNHGFVWLAVLGVVNSLISAFYYLRVVYVMYMQRLPKRPPELAPARSIAVVASLAALGVVTLGILPAWIIATAQRAASFLAR